ncbi:MAG: DUF742 domain-containing protein [Kutzneria sp.]|nr:DUF742 domain-containing protein [Kutzneria sp.]MBV9847486.1 DUF742 domain-containing protein [Kutzneria sp.]
MTTEDREDSAVSSFADVLNGFTFGVGGKSRMERDQAHHSDPSTDPEHQTTDPLDPGESAAVVRAYALTGGRTRPQIPLQLETLVSTSDRGATARDPMQVEYRAIVTLCRQTRSVAEVAALLKTPLGVAKVLVADMAHAGLVIVHGNVAGAGDRPDIALMERVLGGLHRL